MKRAKSDCSCKTEPSSTAGGDNEDGVSMSYGSTSSSIMRYMRYEWNERRGRARGRERGEGATAKIVVGRKS